ncbi:MAG: YfhO family protein, partial [Actinobacteria bacterium]|nr:YfhO family protein [Actinomycetota bacterium]
LYSYGHFDENNSENIFIPKEKIEYSQDLEFFSNKDELFRIFPVAELPEAYVYIRNRSIYYELYYVFGYGYTNPEFNYITILEDDSYERNPNWEESLWKSSLKNNIIISMLNTKYIVLPEQDNTRDFMDSISKSFIKDTVPILDKSTYSKAEFSGSRLSTDKSEIIMSGSQNKPRVYKAPAGIESNGDYMISFEIKKNKELYDSIHFDFYGNGYDSPDQEFVLSPGDISEEYIKVSRIINSGEIPPDTDIFFRMFTNSGGDISVKDLEIYRAERYYDYEIKYSDDDVLVLENKNFIPRFYFVSEVISVEDLPEVKSILWEKDIVYDSDRFDPEEAALVQDADFSKRRFDAEHSSVNIIEYGNHEVTLEIKSEGDCFLVFSDNYYPEWKAYIDDIETEIYRTNGIVKGVYIPKGTHKLEFSYIPGYFWLTTIVSLVSLAMVIMCIIFLLFKRRKSIKSVVPGTNNKN